jgi:hypothetical protein
MVQQRMQRLIHVQYNVNHLVVHFDKMDYKCLLQIRVKTHCVIHKVLSHGHFCKILEFVIGHVIKCN